MHHENEGARIVSVDYKSSGFLVFSDILICTYLLFAVILILMWQQVRFTNERNRFILRNGLNS
jgi:hypothetical protein